MQIRLVLNKWTWQIINWSDALISTRAWKIRAKSPKAVLARWRYTSPDENIQIWSRANRYRNSAVTSRFVREEAPLGVRSSLGRRSGKSQGAALESGNDRDFESDGEHVRAYRILAFFSLDRLYIRTIIEVSRVRADTRHGMRHVDAQLSSHTA